MMRWSLGRCVLVVGIAVTVLVCSNMFAFYLTQTSVSVECEQKIRFYQESIINLEQNLEAANTDLLEAKQLLEHASVNSKPASSDSQTARTSHIVKESKNTANVDTNLPTIFMITPTYARWTQKADLTRLCQTLMHVKKLHWIVVEDSDNKTPLVTNFLRHCAVNSTQLNARTIEKLRLEKKEPQWKKHRGVNQRNLALEWLRDKYNPGDIQGVVYFGDDDNTYDLLLFDEMRYTQTMSVWPVGICGGLKWEGPVCAHGKVIDWHTSWAKDRAFPIDFAAFALQLDVILKHPAVVINMDSAIGRVESDFLTQLVTLKEVEAKADNCTKVLVWHTRTEKPKTKNEDELIAQGKPSNPDIEV